jgi:dihydrofolate reductase
MSEVIVATFVTLDGVMEAPGGEPGHPHTGWAADFMGPEEVAHKRDEAPAADSLLVGRITYESLAEGWSGRTGAFADKMNAMPKHVVSTTLRDPAWNNSAVIAGDVAGAVARLKRRAAGPILVIGSRTLVHALIAHDLVDEYRLMVFPVVVGSGRRLFPETPAKTVLRLTESRAFASGVVEQTYRPQAPPAG